MALTRITCRKMDNDEDLHPVLLNIVCALGKYGNDNFSDTVPQREIQIPVQFHRYRILHETKEKAPCWKLIPCGKFSLWIMTLGTH